MEIKAIIDEAAKAAGISLLKLEQEKAIQSFVQGCDVFVSLPTGYGKSLIYGLLPGIFNRLRGRDKSVVLVVSPLTALMNDQVASFTAKGIAAVHVCERLSKQDKAAVQQGEYRIIFISPETLFASLEWRNLLCTDLYRQNLVAFVVDEAHCVKKWGDSFRREFSHLGEIRSIIPEHVHVMALTATATKSTRRAVIRTLNMHKTVVVSKPPVKNNIIYSVARKMDIYHAFVPICDKLKVEGILMGRIIIFCRKYSEVTTLYYFFKHRLMEHFTYPVAAPDLVQHRLVDMYTSCTHSSVKDKIIEQFTKKSPLRIVIGTIAFGMGIDCPDVRQVIHWGVSDDIEMYIQESGRAGRDGLLSFSLVLYTGRDLDKRTTSQGIIDYCKNKDNLCRRTLLFSDFDDYSGSSCQGCQCCDVCKFNCECNNCEEIVKDFYVASTCDS